jgi:betaine lipid synthase
MSQQTPLANPFDAVLLVAAFSTAILLGFAWILCTKQEKCRNVAKFMWSCFMKPISNSDAGWGGALESFYAGQADVYDATRNGLLKGRTTMMKLAVAHLRAGITPKEKGNLVWVDVRVSLYHMLMTITDWWRNWMEH